MKTILAFIYTSIILTTCMAQNSLKLNDILKPEDLKGKIWHSEINKYGRSFTVDLHRSGNGFSNQVTIYFVGKDSVELHHYVYSPSIGGRIKKLKGTYQIDNKNIVSIIFKEPEGAFGTQEITINNKKIQYSLYIINSINNFQNVSEYKLEDLPQIKTYKFKIIKYITDKYYKTELTLLDKDGAKYNFGTYKFDASLKQPKH